jgi:hypothetical protein
MSPTARTLAFLRRSGFLADVVERWVPHAEIRRDLFGFADILAFHPRDKVFLLAQTTTAPNMASRLIKAKRRPELVQWLRAGGRFEVHGWYQSDNRWQLRRVEVVGDDLADVVVSAPRRKKGERQRELFDGISCR